MLKTARYTLTTTPIRIDVTPDDNVFGRSLTVFPQASGTIVICDDVDTAPAVAGCRVPVTAGVGLNFTALTGGESVWVAVAAGTLDVDVVETGVAS